LGDECSLRDLDGHEGLPTILTVGSPQQQVLYVLKAFVRNILTMKFF